MSKVSFKKIAFIAIFALIIISILILANQTSDKLQVNTKELEASGEKLNSGLEAETEQVYYNEKLKSSLTTFEIALKDNKFAEENAPEEMKPIIKTANDKKEKLYGEYLELYNSNTKSSKELYFNLYEELSLINKDMEQSIKGLK